MDIVNMKKLTDKKVGTTIDCKDQVSINKAAEAAYQRGLLAEDSLNYLSAFEHYKRAVYLSEENNPRYLIRAAILAGIVGKKKVESHWNRKVLSLLK